MHASRQRWRCRHALRFGQKSHDERGSSSPLTSDFVDISIGERKCLGQSGCRIAPWLVRQVVDHGLDGGTARTFALRSASNPVSYGPHRIAPAVTNETAQPGRSPRCCDALDRRQWQSRPGSQTVPPAAPQSAKPPGRLRSIIVSSTDSGCTLELRTACRGGFIAMRLVSCDLLTSARSRLACRADRLTARPPPRRVRMSQERRRSPPRQKPR